jgi:undecaprenyl-diphosphatase
MTLLQAIILGAVQGVTEFLPISSTAHLILVPRFFGWPRHGIDFDLALHLGTLISLLVYFRTEWVQLLQGGVDFLRGRHGNPNAKLMTFIAAATVPGLIAGALLKDFVDSSLRQQSKVIAAALIVLAIVLVIAERVGVRQTKLDNITFTDAITVGCAQALAIIPGVSRSGITMTAALFRGMTREAAARFSFLLSTPLIGAATSKGIFDGVRHGFGDISLSVAIAGVITSGIVGYISIAFLLRFLATRSMYVFVAYRIILGIVVLAVLT